MRHVRTMVAMSCVLLATAYLVALTAVMVAGVAWFLVTHVNLDMTQ